MKNKLLSALALLLLTGAPPALRAGTPEQENEFTARYKVAYQTGDSATLYAFLYKENANPLALEFYKMMMTNGAGEKISKIELIDLTPDEAKKAADLQQGPDGTKMRLPLKPIKKLRITVERNDSGNSSTSTSESFVAEKDGKFVIPVPVTAK